MSSAAVRYSVTWFTHFNRLESTQETPGSGPPKSRSTATAIRWPGSFFLRRRMTPFRTKAPGLVKKGRKRVSAPDLRAPTNDQINRARRPQTVTDNWDSRLYEPAETIHRLGNLLLVPTDVNASLSNEPWE